MRCRRYHPTGMGLTLVWEQVLCLVAGVLLLGNIRFDECSHKATVHNKQTMQDLADLWRVDPAKLNSTLVHSTLGDGTRSETRSDLSKTEAVLHRDSLARNLYSDLFSAVVERCSKSLAPARGTQGAGNSNNAESVGDCVVVAREAVFGCP